MIVYSYIIVSAALAVTQGSTTPPSIREGSLPPRHSNASLLFTLLQVAGFSETCFSGVLDYCSSAQEEAHYPSLIQELQENKEELQEVKEQLQEVKEELQEGKVKTQEVKEMVQQEIQEVKEMVQQVMLVLLKNESRPRHCMDLLNSGDSGSGLRQVYPYHARPDRNVTVYCDHTVDGGGWTVFQRRVNNTIREDFYRNWAHYQAGFGNINGEFWLGLDHLHELTSTKQELRVDLSDYEGQHRWAKYGIFQVGPEDTNYRLTVGRYSGDARDSMARHNGRQFTTHDADHDTWSSGNCAEEARGAWWYSNCHNANLNGYQYVGDNSLFAKGITWRHWRGWEYSLMRTTMMLRPAL